MPPLQLPQIAPPQMRTQRQMYPRKSQAATPLPLH
jgi:hypothetical protein